MIYLGVFCGNFDLLCVVNGVVFIVFGDGMIISEEIIEVIFWVL